MKQTLILSSGLDGAPAPLGVPPLTGIVGPLSFIDLLGQWLGVDTRVTPDAERISATLAAMQGMEGRFWSASYKVDPWGTARRVLDLRDALLIAGWDGKAHPDNPARVVDLAALPPPPVGLPDVLGALCATTLPSSLPRVALLEPLDLWPPLWRRLLARLNTEPHQCSANTAPGDLGALQRWFTTGTHAAWRGDGSLTLLTSDGGAGCADIVSALLPSIAPNSVLLGADAAPLPLLLRARHQPRAAALTGPTLGAQLLSLALALHWAPFDAAAALEFLRLPEHPLGGSARFLLDAISTHPGYGGTLYREAVENACLAKQKADEARGLEPMVCERRTQARRQAIADWLPETRFALEDGLPASTILSVCRRIAAWAAARQRPQEATPAAALERALDRSGLDRLSPVLLGRILETVTSGDVTLALPEAAHWRAFANPAARLDATPTTLWWLGAAPAQASTSWRLNERKWMCARELQPDDDLAPKRARLALARAISLTSERLILVSPRGGGEAAQPHPLLGLLAGCFGDSLRGAWTEAQELQTGGTIAGVSLPTETLPILTPPAPQRDWTVPATLIGPREVESPSGLEKLLGCQLAWVLSYKAKLYARGPASLPNPNQMVGTLLHEVMHQVFANGYANPPDAAAKAQTLFDRLVSEMASPLLRPENATLYGRARFGIGQAMADLTGKLATAKMTLASAEENFTRPLPEQAGNLTGRLDLLFKGPHGKLVLDAKWTSSAKYYTARLAENRALQLAAYAWLVGNGTSAAYYLLRQRRLLAADAYPFADAQIEGTDLAHCWQDALADVADALNELKSGQVVAAAIEPPETNERRLAIEAPCRFCNYTTLCGISG
ncbi:MAG: PD-(D/E)XK nuclease family protein [Rhizomicrobium sp.]